MVPTARVNQIYNSAKVQYHWVFCRRDPTSDSGYGRVSSMNGPFVLLLLALPAFAWTTSAKASWMDWYDKPNSGYCETAPPGLPLGNYFAQDARLCPENLKRSGTSDKNQSVLPNQRADGMSHLWIGIASSLLGAYALVAKRRLVCGNGF